MTAASSTCGTCGAVRPVAELVVYRRAPGTVVRCRTCGSVLMVFVQAYGVTCVDLAGLSRSLSIAEPQHPGWLDRVRDGAAPGTFPVGLGVLFAELGSPEQDAFTVHQYGVAMTTLSAALRLMRIDHRQVQAILAAVNETAADDYAAVRRASLPDMAGFAPMADILAAVHVRSHIRVFMN